VNRPGFEDAPGLEKIEPGKNHRSDNSGADVVMASACVQLPSLPAIQRMEDMLGIRTVSTAVCTTRLMLDHLGLDPEVPDAGALLAA